MDDTSTPSKLCNMSAVESFPRDARDGVEIVADGVVDLEVMTDGRV